MARPRRGKAASATAAGENVAPSIASAKGDLPVTGDVALPSIKSSSSALQETSGNRLKRPRGTSSDEKGDPYENSPSPKRTPTPTIFTVGEYRAFREKHPVRPWKERKITGQYTIINGRSDSGHYMDTSGFVAKVFYDSTTSERKLYATFKFDKLEGIFRMRRYGDLPTDNAPNSDDRYRRLTVEEFDEACILKSKYWPKRTNSEFRCRWRGKECGDRVLDGQLAHTFEFHDQESTDPNGFPNMTIKFGLFYDDEIFHFKAIKTADLDTADLDRVGFLEQEWKALHDPNPEAMWKIEYQKIGDIKSGYGLERKRYFPINKKRKAEYHPFSNGSRIRSGAPIPPSTDWKLSKKSDWKISGRHWLRCTNRLEPVDATDYCFELHYKSTAPRQLFATFEFGNLKGVMRMCPENAITSRPEKSLSLKDFETACNFDEKTRPGPTSKQWLSRWRALEGSTLKGGETRAQGQVNFKQSSDPYEGGKFVNFSFVMVIDGRHLTFEACHTAELDNPSSDFVLNDEWQKLFESNWETGQNPTLYPTGSIIQIKHKPKPPNPSASVVIQALPEWAWDITGEWMLTSNDILDEIELPRTTKLTMSIFLANNPRHKKIGRQYWSILKFGDIAEACLRFCLPTESRRQGTLKQFVESCPLNDDDWVGPAPKGSPNLEYRWRARYCRTFDKPDWCTDFQQRMDFKMGDDGKLSFCAVMTPGYQPMILDGVKTGNGEPRKSNAPTVKSVWDSYMP